VPCGCFCVAVQHSSSIGCQQFVHIDCRCSLFLAEESLVLLLGLDKALLEEVGVLGVAETDGESSGLGLTLRDIGGGVPDPTAVAADVGGELHVGNDYGVLAFAILMYPIVQDLL
jgi:hypothetical protein